MSGNYETLESLGDVLREFRAKSGRTQPEIATAGGPAAGEQSRMESGSSTASPAAISKYVAAYTRLNHLDVATTLHPLYRLLAVDNPCEGAAVTVTPDGIMFREVSTLSGITEVGASSISIPHPEALPPLHQAARERLQWEVEESADLTFQAVGAPAMGRVRHSFRAPGLVDPSTIALDPLEEFIGMPLHRVRRLLTVLVGEGQPVSPWATMELFQLLSVGTPGAATWTEGPLATLFAEEAPGFPASLPAPVGASSIARQELRELFAPFLEAIVDTLSGPDLTDLVVPRPMLRSVDALRGAGSVIFGVEVARAAKLLASLATNAETCTLIVESDPTWTFTAGRHLWDDTPRPHLDLKFIPGLSTVALTRLRGEAAVVRLRHR